jgi:hypothetical protein
LAIPNIPGGGPSSNISRRKIKGLVNLNELIPKACIHMEVPGDPMQSTSIFGDEKNCIAQIYLQFNVSSTKEGEYLLSDLLLQVEYDEKSHVSNLLNESHNSVYS